MGEDHNRCICFGDIEEPRQGMNRAPSIDRLCSATTSLRERGIRFYQQTITRQ